MWDYRPSIRSSESSVTMIHISAVCTSANTGNTSHRALGATGMSQCVGVKADYMPAQVDLHEESK